MSTSVFPGGQVSSGHPVAQAGPDVFQALAAGVGETAPKVLIAVPTNGCTLPPGVGSPESSLVNVEGDTPGFTPGATVSIYRDSVLAARVKTDSKGRFRALIEPGALGSHTLRVVANGYTGTIRVKRNAERSHTYVVRAVFSIANYGAVPNSQASHAANHTAFTNAIAAAVAAGGGCVYIPRGVWYLSPGPFNGVIITGSNVTLFGEGAGASIVAVIDDAGPYVDIFELDETNKHTLRHVGFRRFSIDERVRSNTTNDVQLPVQISVALFLGFAREDMWVDEMQFECGGMWTVKAADYADIGGEQWYHDKYGSVYIVNRCRFNYTRARTTVTDDSGLGWDVSTVYSDMLDVWVRCCTFRTQIGEQPVCAIELHGGRLRASGNDVENYILGFWMVSTLGCPFGEGDYFDNKVVGCTQGIAVSAGRDRNMANISIRDNYIKLRPYGTSTGYTSPYPGGHSETEVTYATFVNFGIQIEPGTSDAAGANRGGFYTTINITNNEIIFGDTKVPKANLPNIADPFVLYDPAAGIQVSGYGVMDGVTVSGNKITNSWNTGIIIGNTQHAVGYNSPNTSKNITVSNNTLLNCGHHYFRFTGRLQNVSVTNNSIQDDGAGPGVCYGSHYLFNDLVTGTNVSMTNNVLKGAEGKNLAKSSSTTTLSDGGNDPGA